MATLELVEKLRQHADVTYDDAREALDASGDDLLDAIIYLEKKGKIQAPKTSGAYKTEKQAQAQQTAQPKQHAKRVTFGQLMKRFFSWCMKIIKKGNENSFVIYQNNRETGSAPVTVLVLLLVFCFWVVVPLMLVGLFCGLTYRFRGKELENVGNRVMDTVAGAANDIKQSMKSDSGDYE